MLADQKSILIADDDATILTALRMLLQSKNYQVTQAQSPQEVEYFVKQQDFALVLMDLNYQLDTTSGKEGVALIHRLRELDEHLPIVVMTGWASIDIAVAAMQAGANDFIQKPWDNERLLSTIQTHMQLADSLRKGQRLDEENQLLKAALNEQESEDFIARSPAMKNLMMQLEALAKSDTNVLITGENGCGKSVLAKKLHALSNRHDGPFIAVNMGSIPETLFESELFGHMKGAFTDAKTTRIGRVELASQGSLFMDEVGNIPLSQQAKLLRVLEEQAFEKVGSSKTQFANIRVISATNADLQQQVDAGSFRMDLFYRLNTMHLHIPPLRERREDIAPMAEALLTKFALKYTKPAMHLSPHAVSALECYHWPGNIRELSHVIERAVIFCDTQEISASQLTLQDNVPEVTSPSQQPDQDASLPTLEQIEKDIIEQRLARFDGNAQKTAESLGLSRSAFYRRLDKFQR